MNKYFLFLNIMYTLFSSLIGYGFYNIIILGSPIFNYSFTIYYAHLLTGSVGILFGYILIENKKRWEKK